MSVWFGAISVDSSIGDLCTADREEVLARFIEQIKDCGKSSYYAGGYKVLGVVERCGVRYIENEYQGKTVGECDTIISSPEGRQKLCDIVRNVIG